MRVGHEEADMPAPQSFFPALLTLAALADTQRRERPS